MPTAPTPVTPYATPPSSADPANFDARGDAKVADDVVKVGEYNALATNVFTNATEAFDSATSAVAASAVAVAASNAAAAAASATPWVSGTTYADGQRVWSLLDQQLYSRIGAGAGTTDPKLDGTHWARVWVVPELVTAESFFL